MTVLVNAYVTVNNPPALDFVNTSVQKRSLDDVELMPHLNSFIDYIMQAGDGQVTAKRYALYRHIQRVKHHFSFELEHEQLTAFAQWAKQANAIAYMNGAVHDPNGFVLQDANGIGDTVSTLPYPDEAVERKERTEAYLFSLGIQVATSLPPVISQHEVMLRSPNEVVQRLSALLVVAIRAKGLNEGTFISEEELAERIPLGFVALSPKEKAFMEAKQPAEQDVIGMSWRYEAVKALLWVLGWSEMDFPYVASGDVSPLVEAAMKMMEQGVDQAHLRPVGEVLDALDLHYRLHWLVRDTQLKGTPLPVELDTGTIAERHYALNWLVNFESAEWDAVDTPT